MEHPKPRRSVHPRLRSKQKRSKFAVLKFLNTKIMWENSDVQCDSDVEMQHTSLYHDTNSRDSGFDDNDARCSFENETVCMEDDFLENFAEINYENSNFPADFEDLIRKPLLTRPNTDDSTPVHFQKFAKRANSACENLTIKKTKIEFGNEDISTEESIKCAVQKSTEDEDLIGDFSKSCCLPLTTSKHSDLKAISADTLTRLIRGYFEDIVGSFRIIDCRYPYEYEGGHIQGAENVYTKESLSDLLQTSNINEQISGKRHILVFHCEFSSERGPNMYRHLRQEDRLKNESFYPSLNFPEIYLLQGGYKNFYEGHSELCVPLGYRPMLCSGYEEQHKYYRNMCKTLNSDTRRKQQKCRSVKRLVM